MKLVDVVAVGLSIGGIAAPFLMLCIVLLVGFITPEYNPIKHTVSQMATAGRPYAALVNTGFALYGLLIIGFAGSLPAKFSGASWSFISALIVVHALTTGQRP